MSLASRRLQMRWPEAEYNRLEAERVRTYAEHKMDLSKYVRAICMAYLDEQEEAQTMADVINTTVDVLSKKEKAK